MLMCEAKDADRAAVLGGSISCKQGALALKTISAHATELWKYSLCLLLYHRNLDFCDENKRVVKTPRERAA